VELLQHYGLFSMIGEKIMVHGLTVTTYNVLFEVSTSVIRSGSCTENRTSE
jgi:hypothetical protein